MEANTSIYQDIATRTGGDIYIGVVGPVRTGKSTFIKRFMETVVLPQMEEGAEKERANDEMPQSGSGKSVMTTEPKFVPDQAVRIQMENGIGFRVKLIDCVGFVVPEAGGLKEEGKERMVNTPWAKDPLPFELAAKLGTQKVINEHSTIGVIVTTDGSFGEIRREFYNEAEENVIREMKETGKPFVIVLNSDRPSSEETQNLAHILSEKYAVPVLTKNCFLMTEEDFKDVLKSIILEFPIREVKIKLPSWIDALRQEHPLKEEIHKTIAERFMSIRKTGEIFESAKELSNEPFFEEILTEESDLGLGMTTLKAVTKPNLYWETLSDESGIEIYNEADLFKEFLLLSEMKASYGKIASALKETEEFGYGIVTPALEDLKLEEPEIVKQNNGYGVKLKASAPSIHMIKADIQAEISPIVGSESQSEDIVRYLLKEFEEDPQKIWQSNMFGKSLYDLVNEGLNNKLSHMPEDARKKLAETLQRIINEGCGGLICIIL